MNKHRMCSGIPASEGLEGALDSAYLRAHEAAAYSGVSESKLAKLRMRENREDGPNYIKCGGSVIYRKCDLDAWLSSLAVKNA